MKKRVTSFLVLLALIITCTNNVFASSTLMGTPHEQSEIHYIDLSLGAEGEITPQSDGYYYWRIDSKTNQGTVYGSWRLGPQGDGPSTLSVNKQDTVTNTISGSYTSKGAIESSLGVSIGISQSYSVSYSVQVPSGRRYQIKYRPLYTRYKVVQNQYYKIDGDSAKTGQSKTCYVDVFYDWGFSYNVVR